MGTDFQFCKMKKFLWEDGDDGSTTCECTYYHRNGHLKMVKMGTSLAVQWLGLHASTAGGPGSIPDRGTKILQAAWHCQKNFKKKWLGC